MGRVTGESELFIGEDTLNGSQQSRIWGWAFWRQARPILPSHQGGGTHGVLGLRLRVPHAPLKHTHKQPASCISERPGLTRREGVGRMGGPGRIQLHLFSPVGHRLVAPGG